MAEMNSSQLTGNSGLERLLYECEQISHDERMTYMVKLGRQAGRDPLTQDLINQLQQRSIYEQLLGLQTCHGSRHVHPALEALKSSSRLLSGRAISIVARQASANDILAVVPVLPKRLLGPLIRELRSSRRRDVVDAIILELSQTKRDEEALRLFLPYASPALIEGLLPQVSESFTLREWQRLSRCRPSIAVVALTERLKKVDAYEIKCVMTGVLPVLARTDLSSEPIFGLVKTALKFVSINDINIQSLLQRFPQQVVGVILEGDEQIKFKFHDNTFRYLTPKKLVQLREKQLQALSWRDLDHLSTEQCLALYQPCANSMRSPSTGLLPLSFISGLPTKERIIEARRALSLDPVEIDASERASHAALLPWDEAMKYNTAYLRDNDAKVREDTVSAQIKAAKYQRDRFSDALEIGIGCRNELDAVRRAMLKAYAKLPRRMWREEHLPQLAQVIQHTLKNSDTHNYTLQATCALVVRLLSVHVEWSLRQFAILFKAINDANWHLPLEDINARSCSPEIKQWMASGLTFAMTPLLYEWKKEENQDFLITICVDHAFEPLLEYCPAIMNVLDGILKITKSSSRLDNILEIIRKHRRADFASTIERLIAKDPSCITIETVRDYLHRRRQHLLTPFLRQEPIRGRFREEASPYRLKFVTGLFRLTQKQQELFVQSCFHTIQHNNHWDKEWEYRRTLRILGNLNYTDVVANISKYANDENPVIKDTALRSLGHVEGGKGVPALLKAIEDGDTRIAIVPLGLQLRQLSPEKSLQLLKAVPATQITVMKEVVRLVGDLGTDDAYNYLLKIETRDNLHKDIRIAILKSLEQYTDKPETWEVYRRAASETTELNQTIPMTLVSIPSTGLSTSAKTSLLTILATLLTHPISLIRTKTLQRLRTQPLSDPTSHLLPTLTPLLHSPIPLEFKTAATILFTYYAPNPTNHILPSTLFSSYLAAQNYPRLTHLFTTYTQNQQHLRKRLQPATLLVLDVLGKNELTKLLYLRLCFASLAFPDLVNRVMALEGCAELADPDVFATLDGLIRELGASAGGGGSGGSGSGSGQRAIDVAELEAKLVGSSDERMRALGVSAVVAQSQGAEGWTGRLRGVLEGLRGDRSVGVRRRAVWVQVPRWVG